MDKEIIKKIFEKHLEHDLFFDKKILNVADNSSQKSFNTIPNKTIRIIHQKKRINPSKIGKTLGIGKSTVTSTIDSLESKGMVVRKTDPNDRRKQWISLTQKGEAYHDELVQKITENVAKISEKYGIELRDLEDYYVHLSKMVEILGKYMK
ncbi:MarR family winged helix-turn-helix transcriptional regulator [Methanococcoides methylutens]|uniref:MarR family winged helix-turn-helix transcriptional regulator n=1 Tax=Methanococcoides methylutens TaxID=2226 RepID=UPI0040440635